MSVLPPWTVDELREHNVQHVYPCYGRAHETEGLDGGCWCSPFVDEIRDDAGEVTGKVITHREEN